MSIMWADIHLPDAYLSDIPQMQTSVDCLTHCWPDDTTCSFGDYSMCLVVVLFSDIVFSIPRRESNDV
jgi:hypothetical protein